ncbi:FAD-dependent monooxygenase [Polymorphospora rubra]|uniref:FAD-dependent oxidoreductase n=1 Tax=Polymorphospora rubra TaxID=338584 RepID=A0A810MVZ0_9ACTN|nr:FAD-dependent monooxygenase [Polymorphospora rubra]BCJ64720.1 FAD-dependent oxidoreductase [Polymorphospora rubra]
MKILIVGGGIAGSALALALHRAGLTGEVAEARPDTGDTGGAFLTLAPNGVNALRALGLGDVPAAAGGFELSGLDFRNARGRRIGELPGEHDQQRYGARGVVLRRSRLRAALVDRARAAGVAYTFDARLERLDEHTGGVRAVFADGRVVDADIVIGADGVWSTVRRLTWPDAPTPAYTGIVDCGGWTAMSLPDTARQQMVFGRRAFFGYAAHDGLVYWFTNVPHRREPRRGELDRLDQARWMADIRALHDGDPAPVPAILAAAESSLGAWPVYDLRSLDAWHTSRVCLVGDAAHAASPSSGQGASLAVEDAAVLAGCLRDRAEPVVAFDDFVTRRRDRAEAIVRMGRRIGDRKITSAAGNLFRDLMLPTFLKMGAKAGQEQYAYRVDAQR